MEKNCVLSQNGIISFSDEDIFFGLTTIKLGDFSSKNGNAENSQEKIINLIKTNHASSCIRAIPLHDSAMSITYGEIDNELLTFNGDVLLHQNIKTQKSYIGMIHCSHITLSKKIIEWAMSFLPELDKKNQNTKALVYAGICQDCYEVEKDVLNTFDNQNHGYQKFFKKNGKLKKYQFDLAGLIRCKLVQSGILADNISLINICSHHNTFGNFTNNGDSGNILFSHRRQEVERNLIFCKLQKHDVLLAGTTGNCPYVILY